jgi:hypothetical protein
MANKSDKPVSQETSEQEYVRGGKGRKDEVGRSGIYPASSPDAPENAEVRGQEDLGHTTSAKNALVVRDDEVE